MPPSPARPRHLASSPFQPDPEPVIEIFERDDLVSHDVHGVGRVVGVESGAVSVDFGSKVLRVTSPYSKMTKL
jgi:hypothetical protein